MKSSLIKMFTVAVLIFAGRQHGRSQGTFQNLDFEAADLTRIQQGQFGGFVPIDQALPGWSGFWGTLQASSVLQNNFALGSPNISIFGPDWFANGIIEDQYTVLLQAGGMDSSFVNTSIAQSGLIPTGTQSILLKASGNDFSVDFAGQPVSMIPISTGSNYTLYGGDVSQFAGQSGQLTLSALTVPNNQFNNVLFDSIVFSPQVVPEPGVVGLLALGSTLLGWRMLCKQR